MAQIVPKQTMACHFPTFLKEIYFLCKEFSGAHSATPTSFGQTHRTWIPHRKIFKGSVMLCLHLVEPYVHPKDSSAIPLLMIAYMRAAGVLNSVVVVGSERFQIVPL